MSDPVCDIDLYALIQIVGDLKDRVMQLEEQLSLKMLQIELSCEQREMELASKECAMREAAISILNAAGGIGYAIS